MSIRQRIARKLIGKEALGKSDFGDFGAFVQMYGGKSKTGEIGWSDYDRQRKEYRGTSYACIRKIAPAVAATPLHLFIPAGSSAVREAKRIPVADEMKEFLLKQQHCKAQMIANSEEVEEVTKHPALDVFKRANGAMSQAQLFDMSMVYMGLNGNCYWEPILNQTGAYPAQIRFREPGRIKPTESNGMTVGYEVKRKFPLPPKKFELDEIIHFFYPGPFSMSQGYSPIAAASQRISAEVNTSAFQNSTLENMGVPAAMVKITRRMGDDEFKEFKRKFGEIYKGVANQGKVGFTTGEWEIEKLGQTLQEMGYIEGSRMLREFIANDLLVPISKLTMESSNRAVAEAGNTEFMRDTILPNLTFIAAELTESLIPMFPSLVDSGAFYMFENPVPEDTRLKIMSRRVNRTTGVTTPNEERLLDGMEPHESEEADSLAPASATATQGGAEEMARSAIDGAVDKAIGEIRNGDCDHD